MQALSYERLPSDAVLPPFLHAQNPKKSPCSFADAVPTRPRASSSSSEALVDENTLAGEGALGRGLTLGSASGSRSPEDEAFGAALALLPTRTLLALASDMFQAKEIRVFFTFGNFPFHLLSNSLLVPVLNLARQFHV